MIACALTLAVGLAGTGSLPNLASPATLLGIVCYAEMSHGPRYLAMRLPRGTAVRICGPNGCVVRSVNDWGPNARIHPDRIADLSYPDFGVVCGDHAMGLCRAWATVLPGLPATDTDGT